MPIVSFDSLPKDARVWIFASDHPLAQPAADRLLREVDAFLERWQAHGAPLRCARQWKDDRFLAIGVDPTTANASGCSIDGLFRTLQALESVIGSRLVGGGRVFYREASGVPHVVTRDEFADLVRIGIVTRETLLLDTALTSAADWRERFERPTGESWAASFFDG